MEELKIKSTEVLGLNQGAARPFQGCHGQVKFPHTSVSTRQVWSQTGKVAASGAGAHACIHFISSMWCQYHQELVVAAWKDTWLRTTVLWIYLQAAMLPPPPGRTILHLYFLEAHVGQDQDMVVAEVCAPGCIKLL